MLHREGDDDLDDRSGREDREIHLGTLMILAIFFGLAVLCAAFFGFGYSMGHKAVPATAAVVTEGSPNSTFAGFKPTAGKQGQQPSGQTVSAPIEPPAVSTPTPRNAPAVPVNDASDDTPPPAPAPKAAPATPAVAAMPVTSATGTAVVQIAAVSHQEDADLLVTTLKRRGYNVVIRSEPQDKLLHVQVGPFASHKDADSMRLRLLADGFNAIVKDTK